MKLAFNNALRTTRSTFACSAKGGSASLLAKAFGAPKTMPKTIAQGARNTPLHIAREGLLDIKFRRQSRIGFANALRTTRSTFARLAKGGSASLLAKAFGAPKTM